jgi:hypothetical protein
VQVKGPGDPPPPPRGARGVLPFQEALERAVDGAEAGLRRGPRAPALPELREAVGAIPPAIWAGKVAGGDAIELAFGPHLAVELRQVPDGIEIAVRVSPALARAAQGDLPAMVRALRERGVVVVRAELRPRAPGAVAHASARAVDARPPLR